MNNHNQFTHGSLFSGMGGFDLAAEWMGWENKFHCEWNPFGAQVLKYYWPNAESFHDITKTDFTPYANRISILSGGFPCQPYSLAGKRKGKEDERHLWPEMLRAIREIQPRWVVGENVFGLINWSGGLVFHEVQADLEAAGYEVWPYVLPAVSVNAPHRRDRVWFVAHRNNARNTTLRSGTDGNGQTQSSEWEQPQYEHSGLGNKGNASNSKSSSSQGELQQRQGQGEFGRRNCEELQQDATNPNSNGQFRGNSKNEVKPSKRRIDAQCDTKQMGEHNASNASVRGIQGHRGKGKNNGIQADESYANNSKKFRRMDWENFPTQPPVCAGNDGFSTGLDGITFSKWRNESIKAAGNAIVPQVAFQIFKTIEQYEQLHERNF